ncbi:MAG: nodulation protein NfeD [Betaproteobacteria bacterium]|nr:nodulation protein NfeD [Betaproteobacteria bacterium]
MLRVRIMFRQPFSLLLLLLFGLAVPAAAQEATAPVVVLAVDGAIGPATADFLSRGLTKAKAEGAQLVVLTMDTPGGLDTSMRQIIKDILASPVPVATFVSPSGARAASAGTYILLASHIAAMAPGTNLGAATPVAIGGAPGEPQEPKGKPAADSGEKGDKAEDKKDKVPGNQDAMRSKQVNDAAAYIKGLAQLRGRNAEWAEKAVRESVSLTASEALQMKVIDLVAVDVNDLLRQVNGRKVTTATGERTLNTKSARIERLESDWRTKLLSVITDPSVAYILLLIGIYGLFFEFYNPGFVVPGVVGAIALLTALFALQMLPVSYAGLALLILGVAFMVAEAFMPSFGALGIGGVIAFVLGSIMLIDTDVPGYAVPWSVVAAVTAASAFFVLVVVGMAVKARRRPVVTGREELLGSIGEMVEDAAPEGFAFVLGENWRVRGNTALRKGQKVRVVGVHGLLLDVVVEEN